MDALLAASARRRYPISREELDEVVARNDKKRFAFDRSGTMIRAQQGHSVPVDLGLERRSHRPRCPTALPNATCQRSCAKAYGK